MEEGSEKEKIGYFLVKRTLVVSRRNTKIFQLKRKREFNSSNNLLRTSSSLPTLSVRGFSKGPDVHLVNGKQDSLSTAT